MLHQWWVQVVFTCLSELTGGRVCVSLPIAAGEALIRELGQDDITLPWVCVECLGWHAGAVHGSEWVGWTLDSAQMTWPTGAWATQSECFSVCKAGVG